MTLLALVLFSAVIVVEVTYRVVRHGDPVGLSIPVWVMAIILVFTLLTTFTASYLAAKPLQNAIERFSGQMALTRGGNEDVADDLQFPELRRLRAMAVRTVRRLRRENSELRTIAYCEPVTGLPNEIALTRFISAELPQACFEEPAAFILLDIDQFARAAERFGGGSDALLRAASYRLEAALKDIPAPASAALEGGMLASLSSDRFVLFLPHAISRDHVIAIVRGLRAAFAEPVTIRGKPITLALSGGLALAPEDGDTPATLHQAAKLALRVARSETGSGFRFFSPRMTRIEQGRYRFETELREAIERREFRAVFQPKIDLSTGRIVGAEALARWHRPNGKVISPAAFIPVAEQTGMIHRIGRLILESACESARQWQLEGHDITVAVNVSPSQFERDDLAETVIAALSRSGLAPNRLELEITESIAVSNPTRVAEFVSPLRALGTRLAIDDFGTGHSNLAVLTQLPFDVFKIDRQFVSALDTDRQAPAIVEMILAMAETLGLKTVAEGVETMKQAEFLRRRGCSMAQGFLYSPGLPAAAFLDLVRAWRGGPSVHGLTGDGDGWLLAQSGH